MRNDYFAPLGQNFFVYQAIEETMHKNIFLLFAVTFSLSTFLTSCSSLRGRAEDYLEGGNFHQARLTLLEAIKRDPTDTELHQLKKQVEGPNSPIFNRWLKYFANMNDQEFSSVLRII